jgi:hypothetical protein
MGLVIYTAVVGDYDRIYRPACVEPGVEYVAFTDSAAPRLPAPWQHRPLLHHDRNQRMTSRWHKLHPHVLFPDYDVSLYVDGNVVAKAAVSALVRRSIASSPIALFQHPERCCAYAEAEVVKTYRLDDPEIVDAQINYYRQLGFPAGLGLFAGGIQIRRHGDARLIGFLEGWWQQLKVFSQRDQLSLSFMLCRHGIEAAVIPAALNDNPWFAVGPHKRYRRQLEKNSDLATYDEIDWLRRSIIGSAANEAKPRLPAVLAQSLRWNVMEALRRAKRHYARFTWRDARLDRATKTGARGR